MSSTLKNTILLSGILTACFFFVSKNASGQQGPPWWFKNTGQNHTILISDLYPVFINNLPADSGDYIGVFYDSLGQEACGGYVLWENETTALSAWGEDEGNDGFKAGELFHFRIWDATEKKEFRCLFEFNGEDFPSYNTYQANGMSGLNWLKAYSDAIFQLSTGWNFFCPNVGSVFPLDSLVSQFNQKLQIMKNSAGQVWFPSENLMEFHQLNAGEIYRINLSSEIDIQLFGLEKFQGDSTFSMDEGFSLFPYYFDQKISASYFFDSSLNNIELIRDDQGNLIWPVMGISQIQNLSPFEAYWIKSSGAFTVHHPDLEFITEIEDPFYAPVYFSNVVKQESCMFFGLPLTAWDSLPEIGDEIGVSDLSGRIFGAAVFEGKDLGFVVWGDNVLSQEKDGLKNFEPFRVVIWRQSTGFEDFVNIGSWIQGDSIYGENKISIVEQVKKIDEPSDRDYELNVLSEASSTWIEWILPVDAFTHIDVFSIHGQFIENVVYSNGLKGKHRKQIQNQLAPGIYLVRLQAAERMLTERFIVF